MAAPRLSLARGHRRLTALAVEDAPHFLQQLVAGQVAVGVVVVLEVVDVHEDQRKGPIVPLGSGQLLIQRLF